MRFNENVWVMSNKQIGDFNYIYINSFVWSDGIKKNYLLHCMTQQNLSTVLTKLPSTRQNYFNSLIVFFNFKIRSKKLTILV